MQETDRKTVTLVLGGVRSGKSRWAQQLAAKTARVAFVAAPRFCGSDRCLTLSGTKHTLLPIADLQRNLERHSQFIQALGKLHSLGWRWRFRSANEWRSRLEGVSPIDKSKFVKRLRIFDSKRDRRRL